MHSTSTAVELTRGDDHLNIWVDANNNGVRDDDDVNIFITKAGGFYTSGAHFKSPPDRRITEKLKQASVDLLDDESGNASVETTIRDLALELVQRAMLPLAELAEEESELDTPEPAPHGALSQAGAQQAYSPNGYAPQHPVWAHADAPASLPLQGATTTVHSQTVATQTNPAIPMWRPQQAEPHTPTYFVQQEPAIDAAHDTMGGYAAIRPHQS